MNSSRNDKTSEVKSIGFRSPLQDIFICFLFATLLWITHFRIGGGLGLHDEDFMRIPYAISDNARSLFTSIIHFLHLGRSEGRPLHPIGIYIFSFLGHAIGGLNGIYFANYCIILTNTYLIYFLLRKLSNSIGFALAGGLAFILFPIDTTRNWLTIGFGAQPAIGLVLLAMHLYMRSYRLSAYCLAGLSLFWYETPFPIFLMVPALHEKSRKIGIRGFVSNGIICFLILLGTVILRKLFGESRVGELGGAYLIRTIISNSIIGPLNSLGMTLYKPIEFIVSPPLGNVSNSQYAFPLLPGILLGIAMLAVPTFFCIRLWRSGNREEARAIARIYILGLACMACSYLLTLNPFSNDVTVIIGRNSRIHLGASIGYSIFIAGVYLSARRALKTDLAQKIFIVVCLTITLLQIGAFQIMQANYRLSWQYQQAFWSDAVVLMGDISEDTIVMLEGKSTNNPGAVGTHSFPLDKLTNLYQFPDEWDSSPELLKLLNGWRDTISISDDSSITLSRNIIERVPGELLDKQISTRNIILLSASPDGLSRLDNDVIQGNTVLFKPTSEHNETPHPPGILYDYLVQPDLDVGNYLSMN